jgi:uncharacterized membrane protein YdcZ (DUF606 family)
MKVLVGGLMGAFLVTTLAFVAPKIGPTQTYFLVIAVVSALIDSFGLLGTEAKPLQTQQLVGVVLAGVSASCSPATNRDASAGRSSPAQALAVRLRHAPVIT